MVAALFDTSILIDYLNEIDDAGREFDRYERNAISVISWIEVLVGVRPEEEPKIRDFLLEFELVRLDDDVAELSAVLRRTRRIRLPDAIIWASAQARGMLLVTRNTKDFPANDPAVRIPYRL